MGPDAYKPTLLNSPPQAPGNGGLETAIGAGLNVLSLLSGKEASGNQLLALGQQKQQQFQAYNADTKEKDDASQSVNDYLNAVDNRLTSPQADMVGAQSYTDPALAQRTLFHFLSENQGKRDRGNSDFAHLQRIYDEKVQASKGNADAARKQSKDIFTNELKGNLAAAQASAAQAIAAKLSNPAEREFLSNAKYRDDLYSAAMKEYQIPVTKQSLKGFREALDAQYVDAGWFSDGIKAKPTLDSFLSTGDIGQANAKLATMLQLSQTASAHEGDAEKINQEREAVLGPMQDKLMKQFNPKYKRPVAASGGQAPAGDKKPASIEPPKPADWLDKDGKDLPGYQYRLKDGKWQRRKL